MPSIEREPSRDSERYALTHRQSASSDNGRAIVPMWDSSDPERAPPPLPMNPSSPSVASRANTSAAIKSAHAALNEKARENAYSLNPPPKRMTEPSPERLLIKGAAHKRMQSLQPGNVRDLSSFIEQGTFGPHRTSQSPEKAATRPATPHSTKEQIDTPDKSAEKAPNPTTTTPTKSRDMSPVQVRPSLRRPPQGILGENAAPQSATMQALHNMATRDADTPPLANVTNGSNALVRTPQTFDAISNQILSLTSICTSLQREMAQLSRRSKDNATDLVSLKEATNARDEDIRKSLRELVTGLSECGSEPRNSSYGGNGMFIDSRAHNPPHSSRSNKPFHLPRIPSPNSFAASLDRESMISSPFQQQNSECPASLALLEKILREMGTKEGQELLISRLAELAAQLGREGMSQSKKLEDLIEFVKEHTETSRALITRNVEGSGGNDDTPRGRKFSFDEAPRLEIDFDKPGSLAQRMEALAAAGVDRDQWTSKASPATPRSSEVLTDDMMRIIRVIKDSVSQGGGLTAEVKALVRELRGEVLGMGREIGRKLDEASKDGSARTADVSGVVKSGLEELKEHMNQLIRESRRQSSSSAASRHAIDQQEIFNAVRAAVNENAQTNDTPGIEKEYIIEAVREAWVNYKPDLELQHYGLEKEELLACLKEGLQEYAPQDDGREPGATREEVFAAVVEGLKHFSPPKIETVASLSREEVLDAVRECLEEFEFPAAPLPEPREPEITRHDMLDAVKEGLHTFDFAANTTALTRSTPDAITRDDVAAAVKEAFGHIDFAALNRNADGGVTRDDMLAAVREGLQNFGLANGNREMDSGVTRDDMVSAVTESLHTFDFAANVPELNQDAITRDEMFEAIKSGLESFEFPSLNKEVGGSISREDVFDAVKESLHTFNFGALVPASNSEDKASISREDVFEAVKDGLQTFDSALTREVGAGISRDDIFDAVKEGLHTFDSALTKDVGAGSGGITRGDVMDAVKEVLTTFDSALTRDVRPAVSRVEIVDAMQEVLMNFNSSLIREPPAGITRNDVVDAVQEVMAGFNSALTREGSTGRGVTQEEVFEAVKVGLEAHSHINGGGVTRNEVVEAVKEGLQSQDIGGGLTREEVIDAVQHVLGTFDSALTRESKGLTREDVFDAVKDSLQTHDIIGSVGRDEMLEAVRDGLESIRPPTETEALTRDDVFDAVKNGFEIHNIGSSITRDDVFEAVKESLKSFDPISNSTEKAGISRDDVFEAVKDGLQSQPVKNGATREDVLEAVKDALQTFNTALTKDTQGAVKREDVFEAVQEGLEKFNSALTLDIPVGVSREDVMDAVKEGLHTFDSALTRDVGTSVSRDDILEAVKEGLENFDFATANNSSALSRDVNTPTITREDVFEAVKLGLESLPRSSDTFTEQVASRLEDLMGAMRKEFKAVSEEAKQNMAASGRDTEQLLDATKDGFENLRVEIESYVDRASDVTGKDEILESMRESFDVLRTEIEALVANGANGLDTAQEELDDISESVKAVLVKSEANTDKDQILDALKEGLNAIRSEMERSKSDEEEDMPTNDEILEALETGLDGLRIEVEKVGNKPVDMTINHEILNTLKAGLESVREEIDALKNSNQDRALARINEDQTITPAVQPDNLKRADIENLEVLITQLRIKVEALESTEPLPIPGAICKDDLTGIEEMLRAVQERVDSISQREDVPDESGVKKEDLDSIETLLRNTKAKIEEIDLEQSAKKEDIEAMGAIVLEARDGLNDLTTHLAEVSKKDDISAVESLVREVMLGLAEIKEKADRDSEDVEKVTKTDVEAVEAVCLDVKSAIEQTVLPEFGVLATKNDVNSLGDLVKEFKGRIEHHAESNAKSFEERQAETVGVGLQVKEVKSFLEEFRDAIKEMLDEGTSGVESVSEVLKNLGETINKNGNITEDVKEMFETMKTEFENTNASIVGSKLETDEKFQQTWDKFDSLLEAKFKELISKNEDAQISMEQRAKVSDERTEQMEIAVVATKEVVDDLKILNDGMTAIFAETAEKIDESSKAVFGRVDETFARVEETHADAKNEHQLTREQILKTLGVVEGVQGNITEYNPQILESIKEVLLVVGQHYEHTKSSTETIQEKIAEHSKSSTETIQAKIAEIPPPPEIPPIPEPTVVEKYDDTQVHEKLDKLVGHMQEAGQSIAQLDMLDKIHKQVVQTAAEVSQFVSVQTQRIADDHEDKEKAYEETIIALEKRLTEKDQAEAAVAGLRVEEDILKDSVSHLKTEQDQLIQQKMRLTSDVSSLETALRIRREELAAMEARAEGLERRILESVIDQSRALLMAKNQTKSTRDPMSRKRVSSQRTSTTGSVLSDATSKPPSVAQSAVNMAMKAKAAVNSQNGASRRILSLSQINHNVPTGNFKRSHSVKTHGGSGLRKSSWGGAGTTNRNYGELNKENLALNAHEEEIDESSDGDDDTESDGTAMRRGSHGTTINTGAGTIMSETIDESSVWTGSVEGDSDEENSIIEEHDPVMLYQSEEVS